MRVWAALFAMAALAACATAPSETPSPPSESAAPAAAQVPPPPPPPPASARTPEQFDTTTAEDRAEVVEAATSPPDSETMLGVTVVSLGNPAEPGFWLETPLVSAPRSGRVLVPSSGASVAVELRPSGGAGSRLSLAAMRLLEVPLTSLPEVEVFASP